MNCTITREQLPALIYGDVPADERAELEKHLAECCACRREYVALQGVQRLLGTQGSFPTDVDLSRLYRVAAERAARQTRRWRWIGTIAAGAAAALALFAFAGQFEAHWENQQLVLRWGAPPANGSIPLAPPRASPPAPAPADESIQDLNKQLQVLSRLVQAVVDDLQEQDRQHQQSISELLARLEAYRKQNNSRFIVLEKEMDTLNRLSQKGE